MLDFCAVLFVPDAAFRLAAVSGFTDTAAGVFNLLAADDAVGFIGVLNDEEFPVGKDKNSKFHVKFS